MLLKDVNETEILTGIFVIFGILTETIFLLPDSAHVGGRTINRVWPCAWTMTITLKDIKETPDSYFPAVGGVIWK